MTFEMDDNDGLMMAMAMVMMAMVMMAMAMMATAMIISTGSRTPGHPAPVIKLIFGQMSPLHPSIYLEKLKFAGFLFANIFVNGGSHQHTEDTRANL